MSGPSPSLLSPFWTHSHPKTVGYCPPPRRLASRYSPPAHHRYSPSQWHIWAPPSTPTTRDQHRLGRTFHWVHWDHIWSCLESKQEYFSFADIRLAYACPLTGQKPVLWHTYFSLLSYTTDASIFPILITHFFRQWRASSLSVFGNFPTWLLPVINLIVIWDYRNPKLFFLALLAFCKDFWSIKWPPYPRPKHSNNPSLCFSSRL
jgi:hypothetical protein